jgi:DNA (cytosine-5)-methyltransferase 1
VSRPRILDLFCGAGGAGMGYHRAGFDVVGVDIKPQPRYPFDFVQLDALDALDALLPDGRGGSYCLADFDAIHASPPCQASSSLRSLNPDKDYAELIPPTRALLERTGLPYVIENVVGSKLRNPVQLCGSAFRLGVRRHRRFEVSFPLMSPGCAHGLEDGDYPVGLGSSTNAIRQRMAQSGRLVDGPVRSKVAYVYGSTRYAGDGADRKRAMGIDWMTNGELTQAIPPAYTEHIGYYLLREIGHRATQDHGKAA